MSPNQRQWPKPIRDEMRQALREQHAIDENPCPECRAEQGTGCSTAAGSTRTCRQRVALIPAQRRDEAHQ